MKTGTSMETRTETKTGTRNGLKRVRQTTGNENGKGTGKELVRNGSVRTVENGIYRGTKKERNNYSKLIKLK